MPVIAAETALRFATPMFVTHVVVATREQMDRSQLCEATRETWTKMAGEVS